MEPKEVDKVETVEIDGGVSRVIWFKDGSGRIESWYGGRWVSGGATLADFFHATPASPAKLKALGIPWN